MNLTRGINLRKIAELMPGASGAEVKVNDLFRRSGALQPNFPPASSLIEIWHQVAANTSWISIRNHKNAVPRIAIMPSSYLSGFITPLVEHWPVYPGVCGFKSGFFPVSCVTGCNPVPTVHPNLPTHPLTVPNDWNLVPSSFRTFHVYQ